MFVPKKVGVFRQERYSWSDPWGHPHEESALRLIGLYVTRLHPNGVRMIDNGYERYEALTVELPGYGVATRVVNRISYHGGAWWKAPGNISYVIHDMNTVTSRDRFLYWDGSPVSAEEIFS